MDYEKDWQEDRYLMYLDEADKATKSINAKASTGST